MQVTVYFQLEQRINPLTDLEKMSKEPKSYWLSLLKRYFVDGKLLALEAYPSIEEQQRLAADEKQRIEEQVKRLGEEGLKQKATELDAAVDYNERPPPNSMLTCLSVPSLDSISFHNIVRYRTDLEERQQIDLSKTPVFTYFDNVKSGFVYVSSKNMMIVSQNDVSLVDICVDGHHRSCTRTTTLPAAALRGFF